MRYRELAASLLGNAVNFVGIGLVLAYVIVEARSGISLDGTAIAEDVRDVLWFALLCGLASFATIEILKRIFQLRGLYQYRQTQGWLRERAYWLLDEAQTRLHVEARLGGREDAYELPAEVEPGLWAFSTLVEDMGLDAYRGTQGGEVRRVFNLPTEQLAAQVSAAADVALSTVASRQRPDDSEQRFLIATLAAQPAVLLYTNSVVGEAVPELAARLRQGVDQLQISLGERWRRYVQGAALWISGAYGIAFVRESPVQEGAEARYVLAALLLGGLFAWVARDLAAVLERLRR